MDALSVLSGLIGALVGAAVPSWVAWRVHKQSGQVEFRARLDSATRLLGSNDPVQRRMGRIILASLTNDPLGSDADRALAFRLAEAEAEAALSDEALDPPGATRDNECEGPDQSEGGAS